MTASPTTACVTSAVTGQARYCRRIARPRFNLASENAVMIAYRNTRPWARVTSGAGGRVGSWYARDGVTYDDLSGFGIL